jgi:hypothetical protein
MALPLSGLTLHCDAKDTDKLFTNLNGGGDGVHTGAPADGAAVSVWDDEGDGIADVAIIYDGNSGTRPLYRSGTPLMKHPCLDFDGIDDYIRSRNQADSAHVVASNLVTNTAYTIIVALRGGPHRHCRRELSEPRAHH